MLPFNVSEIKFEAKASVHFKEEREGSFGKQDGDISRWAEQEREVCRRAGKIKIETKWLRQKAAHSITFQMAESLTSEGKEQRELELSQTLGSFNFYLNEERGHEQKHREKFHP